ncbi:hypothetical protein [Los Azufres archaeal virus 1]|nr:hypothetical protein [Los Azufres archaeal virus 1]
MLRFLISNLFIGIFTVPVYIFLHTKPFYVVFPASFAVTLSVLLAFFSFLSKRFVTLWALLEKVMVTLPTSFTLAVIVKHLNYGFAIDYLVLLALGYAISTPLLILSYKLMRWFERARGKT